MRADRVGRGLTPEIDALAARGTSYGNVRAAAPLTLPSHVSLMTGTLPPVHGVRENGMVFDGRRKTIARTLADAGYRTAAFVGAYVLSRRFGLDDGFEVYDDAVTRDPARAEQLEAERQGGAVVDAALRWLGMAPGPFFLWIHLYDPHAPYQAPAGFAGAGRDPYDAEVAYADAQVGRVVSALSASGFAPATIVAVTSDHGEALGEHGERTHGMLTYDATLRVPLVIAKPGGSAARYDEPISLADLGPMLLQEAGVAAAREALPVYAESLYPRQAGWHALTALADERWKLIRSSERELFDLRADPDELANVAGDHPGIVEAMTAAIDGERSAAAPASAIAPEAVERLRALGYASGGPVAASDDSTAANPAREIQAWTVFEEALGDLQAGRASQAVAALRPLASRYPGAPVFQTTYARALSETGRSRDALAVYRAAAARWPTSPTVFHDLAVAAREAGDRDEARRAEEAALALEPGSAMALNGLGLLHADEGRHADAAAAFERAAGIDPTNASYWANLGNARRALDDAPGAEAAFTASLDADAGHADALNGLGTLRVQAGRAADAVRFFERALARDPRLHEARLNLGIALQESGQRDRAAAVYRELLETAPPTARRERDAARALLEGLR